jgi:hypothetical protein
VSPGKYLAHRLIEITSCQQQTQRTLLDWPRSKKLKPADEGDNKGAKTRRRRGRWGGQETAADRRARRLAISAFCFPNFSFSAHPPEKEKVSVNDNVHFLNLTSRDMTLSLTDTLFD